MNTPSRSQTQTQVTLRSNVCNWLSECTTSKTCTLAIDGPFGYQLEMSPVDVKSVCDCVLLVLCVEDL